MTTSSPDHPHLSEAPAMTTRLIDFHTNCSCGREVHAALGVVRDHELGPMLAMQVQTTGASVEQRVPVQTAVKALDHPAPSAKGRTSKPAQRPAEPQRDPPSHG
jgi:hypothetical protein